jgi:hypothetical protein
MSIFLSIFFAVFSESAPTDVWLRHPPPVQPPHPVRVRVRPRRHKVHGCRRNGTLVINAFRSAGFAEKMAENGEKKEKDTAGAAEKNQKNRNAWHFFRVFFFFLLGVVLVVFVFLERMGFLLLFVAVAV